MSDNEMLSDDEAAEPIVFNFIEIQESDDEDDDDDDDPQNCLPDPNFERFKKVKW